MHARNARSTMMTRSCADATSLAARNLPTSLAGTELRIDIGLRNPVGGASPTYPASHAVLHASVNATASYGACKDGSCFQGRTIIAPDNTSVLPLPGSVPGDASPMTVDIPRFVVLDVGQRTPFPAANNTILLTLVSNFPLPASTLVRVTSSDGHVNHTTQLAAPLAAGVPTVVANPIANPPHGRAAAAVDVDVFLAVCRRDASCIGGSGVPIDRGGNASNVTSNSSNSSSSDVFTESWASWGGCPAGWSGRNCDICKKDVYGVCCGKVGCAVGVNCAQRCSGVTGMCLGGETGLWDRQACVSHARCMQGWSGAACRITGDGLCKCSIFETQRARNAPGDEAPLLVHPPGLEKASLTAMTSFPVCLASRACAA